MCGEYWFDVDVWQLLCQFGQGYVLCFEFLQCVLQVIWLWGGGVGVLVIVMVVDVVYVFGDVDYLEVGVECLDYCFGVFWWQVGQCIVEVGQGGVVFVLGDGVCVYLFYVFVELCGDLFGEQVVDQCVKLVYVIVQGNIGSGKYDVVVVFVYL